MKIAYKILITIILIALTIFIDIKYDNAIMLILTTLILSFVQIIEFFSLKKQIRKKGIIRIGKRKTYRSTKTISIIGGLMVIIWGFLSKHHVTFEFMGVNAIMCIGFFFFIIGLTTYSNYSILFKSSALIYNDVVNNPEIKYEKIDILTINPDTIKFMCRSREVAFDLTEIDKANITTIQNFLKEKLGSKLIITS